MTRSATGTTARVVAAVRRHRQWIAIGVVVVLGLLGFEALRLLLAEVHLSNVRGAIAAVPPLRIAVAMALTVASYLALTLYDTLALRAIGRPLRWPVAATASFTSYTLSHNLGLALLTGGSARYRIYTAAGLTLGEVAQVTGIAGLTFWGGVLGAAGLALVAIPDQVTLGALTLAAWQARAAGGVLLAVVAALPIARACGIAALRLGSAAVPLPTLRQFAALGVVTLVDLGAASAALFILVPGLPLAAFPLFFLAYAVAIVAGLVTHVPGGLGVFEAVVLAMVPGDRPTVFAALLLYRIVYYLLPLLLAGGLLAFVEGRRLRQPIGTGLSLIDRAARALAPAATTFLVFAGGFVLLVSGALPGVGDRLDHLHAILPLPFIEFAHLGGSLVGTALLLTAPALNARLASGMRVARVLLVLGALCSLAKGLDYEEATVLLGIAAVLHYCRRGFYRPGGVFGRAVDWIWLLAAAAAIGLSVWAGFFAYKRTPYADDLWVRFAIDADVARFLRASLGAGMMLAVATGWRFVAGRHAPAPGGPLPDSVATAALAVAQRSDANLAFTGDKSFVVSDGGDAFLMYAVHGRTWVVMGDPVGPRAAWGELVWAIRRASDATRARLCFFQASEAMLPLFVDLGLQAIKYGEEALIPLPTFTLEGPRAKPLRHGVRRATAAGLSFAIVPAAQVPALLPELRAVSDAWLAGKHGREKRFSLGAFDPGYLARYDIAVVRGAGGLVAFANIWTTADGRELSIDMMRHVDDAPYGTMDMLMVSLFEWGKARGYAHFNLGVSPLSGIAGTRQAPLWAKLARTLYENGERFYGFAGLRAFKAKFAPVWTSRYIATPPGLGMAHALIDTLRLVS